MFQYQYLQLYSTSDEINLFYLKKKSYRTKHHIMTDIPKTIYNNRG